ncbi:MAG: GNAT family N-acetyltransferase [Bacteroidales bacterium]|nr:GNAT family N-acetyltransferase [Bacteroidales bacterium]
MEIINLQEEYKTTYFTCLEDYSEDMKRASNLKENWYNEMKGKGLRVKLARHESGVIAGMVQYFPIEYSWISGKDLYFIGCIWVHGHKQGHGNFQKQGMGTALLKAAEEDVKSLGGKGLVAWGIPLPVWMKASWFKKQGYKSVDKKGFLGEVLLWKPFTDDAVPPKWIKQKKKPQQEEGKVKITCISNGWCPAMNLANIRVREVAEEFGDNVVVEEINTLDRDTFDEWGVSDILYIDGQKVNTGPPPTKEKLRKQIAKKVSRL